MSFNNIYKNKKVLITGHTGFKGSWLAFWLQNMGAELCGYSLQPETNPSHWELLNLDIFSYIQDIRDSEKLKSVFKEFKPEIVFHLAAQPLVRLSYEDPVGTYSTNVMGTLNVLEAARKTESVKAIIVVTSDKCYDNKEWVWGYRETDPMGGYDPYSSSKGCTEILTQSYRNSYFNTDSYQTKHEVLLASARAGNVIGGGDWAQDRLIPDAMKATSVKKIVKIRNPLATRPWQHVLEPLSGYLALGQKLLEQRIEFADAWNFGPDPSGTQNVGQIISALQKNWESIDFEIEEGEHPHEAGLLKLDCSKANQILKWEETLNIDKTIQFTVDWYKSFYEENRVITDEQLTEYINIAKISGNAWTN